MAQTGILPIIYGIITIIIIYLAIRMFYSVKHISDYNQQQLFPKSTNTNNIGMYDTKLFRDNPNRHVGGFKPNKFGSTGASPNGGMRPRFNIPAETAVGWWGYTPNPVRQVSLDIYDNSSNNGIGNKYVSPVGWWNA